MDIDLATILLPETPILEIVIRGTITYLAIFLLLRYFRRGIGGIANPDLLLIVLVADAASNAMADDYRSVIDGLLLVGVIVLWAWTFDWLSYRSAFFGRLVHPQPQPLIEDGELRRQNMRSELVTYEELMSQLRLHGLQDVKQVRRAYVEGNGRISILPMPGEGGSDRSSEGEADPTGL
ncbi:MAG TPA: YetF domain-containing protein [Candidatus Limnocylindrales bacterium]|nr:YetF domain-containing protein [Candidatus Limnocylindrales bacterium]